MKTIIEQIEVMLHNDNGGSVVCTHLRHKDKDIYRQKIIFDWQAYDYDIYEEVKPLFPTKEQGAKYFIYGDGIHKVSENMTSNSITFYAKQGRTFYTLEDAEEFLKREQAKVYCLEAINRVNKGDNGFKCGQPNYYFEYKPHTDYIDVYSIESYQYLESNEYIRARKAAKELINDAEFVENWKVWKGVE